MQLFLSFLYTFLAGGAICLLGQILIIRTKLTPSRILVLFLAIGVVLEATTLYKPMQEFIGSGVTVPIIGFGALLARGAIEGARTEGFLGILKGPLTVSAAGITTAIISAFCMALIFRSRSKK